MSVELDGEIITRKQRLRSRTYMLRRYGWNSPRNDKLWRLVWSARTDKSRNSEDCSKAGKLLDKKISTCRKVAHRRQYHWGDMKMLGRLVENGAGQWADQRSNQGGVTGCTCALDLSKAECQRLWDNGPYLQLQFHLGAKGPKSMNCWQGNQWGRITW